MGQLSPLVADAARAGAGQHQDLRTCHQIGVGFGVLGFRGLGVLGFWGFEGLGGFGGLGVLGFGGFRVFGVSGFSGFYATMYRKKSLLKSVQGWESSGSWCRMPY